MKKIMITLALACGIFTAASAAKNEKPWANGKLQVSANQRFLQFENGQPFFMLGDTGWLLPERLDRAEAQYYLQKCRVAGFNTVLIQVMDGTPSFNIYGQQSLPAGWDLSKADPAGVYSYWDHLDYIIKLAEMNGIYIGMVTIWGSQVKAENINAQQAKAYGKFLANRYKNSPNIIWVMGGDIQGDIHPEVWESLATSIKSIDHNHLMTYHPRGRYTSANGGARRNGSISIPSRVVIASMVSVWVIRIILSLTIPRRTTGCMWILPGHTSLSNLCSMPNRATRIFRRACTILTRSAGRIMTFAAMPTGVSLPVPAAIPMVIMPSCRC